MEHWPERLRVGEVEQPGYELQAALRSVRMPSGAAAGRALAVISVDATTSYAIYRQDDVAGPDREWGPVYSAGPGGPLAVPTGRVLVRLDPDLRPDQLHAEFRAAGFEVERVLPYAPSSAWLRPLGGDVGAALAGLEPLARIPGARRVEPQLLLERAERAE